MQKFVVCTRCGHTVLRERNQSRCGECGYNGNVEVSGPDWLRGMFASIDAVRAGQRVRGNDG